LIFNYNFQLTLRLTDIGYWYIVL